jgi:hypothetical protein
VDWILVIGVAAILAQLALMVAVLRGGKLRREQRFGFVCPLLGRPAECRVVQNIRTGQWQELTRCSLLPDPERVECGVECARLANLGMALPRPLAS